MIYVREAGIGIGPSVAAAALQAIGRPVLGVDLASAAAGRDPKEAVAVLGREALLRGAGVVAGPVEALSEGHAEALRLLADLPLPVAIVGTVTWDPSWTDSVPLVIDAPTLSPTERIALWATELTGAGTPGDGCPPTVPIGERRTSSTHSGAFRARPRPGGQGGAGGGGRGAAGHRRD